MITGILYGMTGISGELHKYLHSFCLNPHTRFETQEEGETVVLVLRAHPVTQIPWVVNSVVILVLLIILDLFLSNVLTLGQIIFTNVFVIAVILAYIWHNFLLYFFNVGVITNKRILDMDFFGILYREVSEANINRVEDITAKSVGYFGSVFNYGNVFIQTAGALVNIEFISVPAPGEAVRIINSIQKD